MWFFLIILSIVICLIALIAISIYSYKPSTPADQIKEFGANMLNYEFGDGYEVIDHMSRNGHPDRPQSLMIKICDEEFNRLKSHIETLHEGEEREEKGDEVYVRTISKRETGCSITHSSIHKSCNYTFFEASVEIDYRSQTVSYSSTFY